MRRMVSDKDIALLEDLESNNINSNTISQIYIVDNIKAISGDILSKLKAGDIVLKNTNGQLHAYNASFKKNGEGICLTYTDASVVETQSYDYTDGAWVYNSEDKVNLVNYSAGDNVSITNGVISATDTTYTAGNNIIITDGVISASGGDAWESALRLRKGSEANPTFIVHIYLITKEELTSSNARDILNAELTNKALRCNGEDGVYSGGLPFEVSISSNKVIMQYYDTTSWARNGVDEGLLVNMYLDVMYSHKIN